jgi:hypothetical protein
MSVSCIRALGNIKTWGIVLPDAVTIAHIVIRVPLSADAACPTCLTPVAPTTFSDRTTVEIPVSSRLRIRSGIKLYVVSVHW